MGRRPKQTLPDPFWLAAFDPGERTGFVVVKVGTTFDPKDGRDFAIDEQGVLTVREFAADLSRIVARVQRVAYERWALYPQMAEAMIGNDMQPSQVVGMIRYEAWKQQKKIASLGAREKKIAEATLPEWLREHKAKSSEEHDKDAIDLAWVECWKYYQRENA